MRSTVIAAGALLISVCAPSLAHAQDARPDAQENAEARARTHFAAGRSLVEQQRYREAYEEFRQGFVLSNRPIFLFNMAECAREAGQHDVARREYQRYLQRDPDGSLAPTARDRLAALPEPHPEPAAANSSGDAVEAHAVPAPDEAARQAAPAVPASTVTVSDTSTDHGTQVYEEWWFWTIIGAVAAGVVIGVSVGVVTQGGPACGVGCAIVDFR